ncbi:acetyltransferase [Sulfurimonas sp.]|uniref:acetyltransferase n=1 Tax=Sulfurimonas sp. TaxID=2022749 RepID=UPI0019FD5DCF|nr:acetyltransferase [Sulfurimonas sp.]MBE0515245.1 acetyltransferase [Sulfurimonas sp.]
MCEKVIIIGNSITAEILYKYITNDKRYQIECFCVDRNYIKENILFGIKVVSLEEIQEKYPPKDYKVLLAMGYNNVNQDRECMYQKVKSLKYEIITYIHKDAKVYNDFNIGEGSIILANTVVEPFAKIGKNSVVWANCTIGHHAEVEDNCWIASGSTIAGEAKIGSNSFLGVGVTVVNQVRVGKLNIIGANVLVSSNTKENEVCLARAGERHRFPALDYAKYFMK